MALLTLAFIFTFQMFNKVFSSIEPKYIHVSGSGTFSEEFAGIYQLSTNGEFFRRKFQTPIYYIYRHKGKWSMGFRLDNKYHKYNEISPGSDLLGYWTSNQKITVFEGRLPTLGEKFKLQCNQEWTGEFSKIKNKENNEKPVYKNDKTKNFLYMNKFGVWMIGNDSFSNIGTNLVSFKDWVEWKEVEPGILSTTDLLILM